MEWRESVLEHVIRYIAAVRDPLGLVKRPVYTQIDSALAVFLLGF